MFVSLCFFTPFPPSAPSRCRPARHTQQGSVLAPVPGGANGLLSAPSAPVPGLPALNSSAAVANQHREAALSLIRQLQQGVVSGGDRANSAAAGDLPGPGPSSTSGAAGAGWGEPGAPSPLSGPTLDLTAPPGSRAGAAKLLANGGGGTAGPALASALGLGLGLGDAGGIPLTTAEVQAIQVVCSSVTGFDLGPALKGVMEAALAARGMPSQALPAGGGAGTPAGAPAGVPASGSGGARSGGAGAGRPLSTGRAGAANHSRRNSMDASDLGGAPSGKAVGEGNMYNTDGGVEASFGTPTGGS